MLSLQEERDRSSRKGEAVAAEGASADSLDIPNDVVSGEGLLELELQVSGRERGSGRQSGGLGAESILQADAVGSRLYVVGSVNASSKNRVEFLDDGSNCEVQVVVVALDEPVDAPARGGMRSGEGGPDQALGGVHGEVESVVRSSGSGTSIVAHEQVGGGDAEGLVGVGQVGKLALFARVSGRFSERVLDALFDGRVADGLCGVSRFVG
jgi:hypothetical protein